MIPPVTSLKPDRRYNCSTYTIPRNEIVPGMHRVFRKVRHVISRVLYMEKVGLFNSYVTESNIFIKKRKELEYRILIEIDQAFREGDKVRRKKYAYNHQQEV